MALIVQKYGGTSVGSPERIKNVAKRVARWKAQGHDVVVVVSAMSGETNRLIALAREIEAQPDPRELDVMVSTGEQVTIALLSMALIDLGLKAPSYTGGQVRILTDSAYTKARIVSIDEHNMRADLKAGCVVAEIPGRAGVPCVVLRADTEALPIQEDTGLDFTSVHDGVMHACGHDGHTTMLLGAAALLSDEKDLPAPVRLIFQPAEEKGTGALDMIKAGALEGAGMIFGGHLDRHYHPGAIVVAEGAVNASSDNFTIENIGQGAHGARPHESIDAVVVGSLMIMALQTIVSREIDPARPSVVSVGQFHAGTAPNVIAGQAKLGGTVRAQDPAVRRQLLASIRRIAESIAQLHGATIQVSVKLPVFSGGVRDVFGEDASLWLAYSQTAWWQITEDSAPFRETNYEPETTPTLSRRDTGFPGRATGSGPSVPPPARTPR